MMTAKVIDSLVYSVQQGNKCHLARLLPLVPHESRSVALGLPWILASRRRQRGCMEVLHSYGVDVNYADDSGLTALHYACRNDDIDSILFLIKVNADPTLEDYGRCTALAYAVDVESIKCINLMTEYMKNTINEKKCQALILDAIRQAATDGKASSLKILVGMLQVSEDSLSELQECLRMACGYGNVACIDILLNIGIDVMGRLGADLLHMAISTADEATLKLLLRHGAPVNGHKQDSGPLFTAISYRQPGCIRLLLHNGAEAASLTSNRNSTLIMAAQHSLRGETSTIELLMQYGCPVNHAGFEGQTALHHCAYLLNARGVHLLLDHDADPNIQAFGNMLPIGMAFLNPESRGSNPDRLAVLHYLIRAGSPVDTLQSLSGTTRKMTPLQLALYFRCYTAALLLIRSGSPLVGTRKQITYTATSDIIQALKTPQSLSVFCRLTIIRNTPRKGIRKLHMLPLPNTLIRFLRYEDIEIKTGYSLLPQD